MTAASMRGPSPLKNPSTVLNDSPSSNSSSHGSKLLTSVSPGIVSMVAGASQKELIVSSLDKDKPLISSIDLANKCGSATPAPWPNSNTPSHLVSPNTATQPAGDTPSNSSGTGSDQRTTQKGTSSAKTNGSFPHTPANTSRNSLAPGPSANATEVPLSGSDDLRNTGTSSGIEFGQSLLTSTAPTTPSAPSTTPHTPTNGKNAEDYQPTPACSWSVKDVSTTSDPLELTTKKSAVVNTRMKAGGTSNETTVVLSLAAITPPVLVT